MLTRLALAWRGIVFGCMRRLCARACMSVCDFHEQRGTEKVYTERRHLSRIAPTDCCFTIVLRRAGSVIIVIINNNNNNKENF